jgi:hypothetical protein
VPHCTPHADFAPSVPQPEVGSQVRSPRYYFLRLWEMGISNADGQLALTRRHPRGANAVFCGNSRNRLLTLRKFSAGCPARQVNPDPISFGNKELLTTSQLSVTITATPAPGELILFITAALSPLSPPFSNNLSCDTSCSGFVSFTPSQVGPANATLSFLVIYSAPNPPPCPDDEGCPVGESVSAQVQLSGNGILAQTPLPAALPLFATGLAGLGFIAYRRKRKQAA